MVIVVDSIGFQLPVTQLPISGAGVARREVGHGGRGQKVAGVQDVGRVDAVVVGQVAVAALDRREEVEEVGDGYVEGGEQAEPLEDCEGHVAEHVAARLVVQLKDREVPVVDLLQQVNGLELREDILD